MRIGDVDIEVINVESRPALLVGNGLVAVQTRITPELLSSLASFAERERAKLLEHRKEN